MFRKFAESLRQKSSMIKLSRDLHNFRNALKNNKYFYDAAISDPFNNDPVKGSYSYSTHNYRYRFASTDFYSRVRFIIALEILCNDANRNNFDIGIFVNARNINSNITNNIKNFSKTYRITACGVKIKSRHLKYKIDDLNNIDNNVLLSSVIEFNYPNCTYYKDQQIQKIPFVNEIKLEETNERIFSLQNPSTDFKDIKNVGNKAKYLILDANDCEYIEMTKHIEHIPLQEYEEILVNDINKNVW